MRLFALRGTKKLRRNPSVQFTAASLPSISKSYHFIIDSYTSMELLNKTNIVNSRFSLLGQNVKKHLDSGKLFGS